MVRKNTLYTTAFFLWIPLVLGGAVVVMSGQAPSLLTAAEVPGGAPAVFGLAMALIAAGYTVFRLLRGWSWRRAGRRAGLSPERDGLFGAPALVGTSRGRTVRARTVARQDSSDGQSGRQTFTVVEADLRTPAETGLVVGPATAGGTWDITSADVGFEVETLGEFAAVGSARELARETLDDRVRETLRADALVDAVYVGDASGVLVDAIPADSGALAGVVAGRLADQLPGGPETVAVETRGLLLEAGSLQRQVEAVVAVAEAFEAAR